MKIARARRVSTQSTLLRRKGWQALTATAALVAVPPLLGVMAQPAAAMVRWDPVDLSLATDSAGLEPASAVNGCCQFEDALAASGENVAVAWIDTRGDDPYAVRDSDVELRRSSDGGTTWGPLLNLSHDDGLRVFGGPAVAASGDATVVAYTPSENSSYSWTSFEIVRVDASGAQVRTSLPGSNYVEFEMANNGGDDFHIARGTGWYGTQGVAVLTSHDDGRTWGDPVTVAASVPEEQARNVSPQVAADGDVVVVAYAAPPVSGQSGTVRNDIWVSTSTDAGATFTPPVRVTQTPQGESVPDVAVHGTDVAIGWNTRYSDTKTAFTIAHSSDAGATWTTPAPVVTDEISPPPYSGGDGYIGAPQVVAAPAGFVAVTQRFKDPGTAALPGLFTSVDGARWTVAEGPQTEFPLGALGILEGRPVWGAGSRFQHAFADDVAPTIVLGAVPPAMSGSAEGAHLSFTVTDPDSHTLRLTCTLNGQELFSYGDQAKFCAAVDSYGRPGPVTSATMPVSFASTLLPTAQWDATNWVNTFTVTAVDDAGNRSVETYQWVVDTRAPEVVTSRLPVSTSKARMPWKVTTTDEHAGVASVAIRIKVGAAAWKMPAAWNNLPATAQVSIPLKAGALTQVSAMAVDAVGNATGWSRSVKVRRP